MTRDANTGFARALVDEWARAGVTHACLAPGSRSSALALALADDRRIQLHVHLDERSAAFLALGAAKTTGEPAVVLCTSGTAAANFHAATLEARHARVPLIVCTADRPPELRDTGAGQTVDQVKLYGDTVRWFCEVGAPDDRPGAGVYWRSIASRAVAETLGPPAGPVHLNLAFHEPLVPTGAPLVDAPGRPDGRPWTEVVRASRIADDGAIERLAAEVRVAERGVVVAGWGAEVSPGAVARLARAAGWPVLADPISGLRAGPYAVSTYDALLRAPGFAKEHRPQLVLRLGNAPTSKAVTAWLEPAVRQVLIDPDGAWPDPGRAVSDRVAADADSLLGGVAARLGRPRRSPWLDRWLAAEHVARVAIDDLLDQWEEPFEGRIARDVVDGLPDGSTLVVASSMPVRDVESFARPRHRVRFVANRGVNGLDGFVSTVLGVATAAGDRRPPVVALLGDLCFLHDANGLLQARHRGVDATFVVVDNNGGGIFSFLPQADLPEHFERLFATPHGVDLTALAAAHAIPVETVEKASALLPAVESAVANGGVRIVLVRTDREENVVRHREVWATVHRALAVQLGAASSTESAGRSASSAS